MITLKPQYSEATIFTSKKLRKQVAKDNSVLNFSLSTDYTRELNSLALENGYKFFKKQNLQNNQGINTSILSNQNILNSQFYNDISNVCKDKNQNKIDQINKQNKECLHLPKIVQNQNQQQKLLINDLQEKSIIFEKLKKRTLRSKILKILNEIIDFDCDKFLEFKKRVGQIEENLNKLNLNQKLNSNQNLYMKKKVYQSSQNKQMDDIFNQISQKLTIQEMLEVGEDPNYFIKNPEHRKIKDLLNPQLWTNIGIGKQKGNLLNKKDNNKCVFSTQLQSQQITYQSNTNNQYRSGQFSKDKSSFNIDKQRSLDNFQNKQHYKKKQDQQFLQQRLEEKLQKATQNKMEYSIKQYSDTVIRNNKRFDEWKKRKNREILIHEDYVNILQNKMAQKWYYLDNKKEQKEKQFKIQQNSKYNKDKILEDQYQKKIQKAQEDNEVFTLNEKLRSICLDQLVQKARSDTQGQNKINNQLSINKKNYTQEKHIQNQNQIQSPQKFSKVKQEKNN